jgi:hypothetical protein
MDSFNQTKAEVYYFFVFCDLFVIRIESGKKLGTESPDNGR